ncbi:hypothetical protein WICMUC_005250 [Wickerhamomyces mucosus]|uniref:Uncharacterized protein n=1 Tax=Wickerhamomyces mucosus TaxID=1378264 RepID=A0A9P8T770_9ASCO|nr:hypothetical protein WICMUC_005250 [Wickerhamomyces mucosus]
MPNFGLLNADFSSVITVLLDSPSLCLTVLELEVVDDGFDDLRSSPFDSASFLNAGTLVGGLCNVVTANGTEGFRFDTALPSKTVSSLDSLIFFGSFSFIAVTGTSGFFPFSLVLITTFSKLDCEPALGPRLFEIGIKEIFALLKSKLAKALLVLFGGLTEDHGTLTGWDG